VATLDHLRPGGIRCPEQRTEPSQAPAPSRRAAPRRYGALAAVTVAALAAAYGAFEARSSFGQARLLSRAAESMSFTVRPGPAKRIEFPQGGPHDQRLGYSQLPKYLDRLGARGFTIERQAEISPELEKFIAYGGYPVYREKIQAGLKVVDRDGHALYSKTFPDSAYADFNAVPRLVADSLLFIEDRTLLDAQFPGKNPAVDWPRFMLAAVSRITPVGGESAGGASTLATQLEKFRHSPGGRTASPEEKLRQMATASMRAYIDGPDSTAARQRIVVDYLNSTPLGSRAGYGEVNGIADGLKVWYGADFAEANKVLMQAKPDLQRAGQTYKQMLSLLLAQRRPAHYLRGDFKELDLLANTYLGVMERDGLLARELAQAARGYRLRQSASAPAVPLPSFTERKAVQAIRTHLLETLDVPAFYDLDRLDLSVSSTIDQRAQTGVTRALKTLDTKAGTKALGLVGHNMLGDEDPSKVIYSVVLYERGADHHAVRVHADSLDAPFDINNSAKMILGSTAKLRTVATYLNIVYDLHQRHATLTNKDLAAAAAEARDPLTSWAVNHLRGTKDRSLTVMLNAAMQRKYSASPYEAFFTGGGIHRFVNFKKEDNGLIPTVEYALRHSINLPMVRLMRDIVRYYTAAEETTVAELPDNARTAYLTRFADQEGREFLNRFYGELAPLSVNERTALLARRAKSSTQGLATLYLALSPKASSAELKSFLETNLGREISDTAAAQLQRAYGADRYSLRDKAFLAGVHPLELWLAAFLRDNPGAKRAEIIKASADVRQDVYQWLFKTRSPRKQDSRIRRLREEDAFKHVLEEWRGQGYPFAQMVPSFASALGSSGDRPDALARLMGIILNDGIDVPIATVEKLSFAKATPYETHLTYAPERRPVRVFAPEVAKTLRKTLLSVVEGGTAVRIHNAFTEENNAPLAIGGKTGTGDNRIKTFGQGGEVTSSRSVDRTATFAFFIGDTMFGTITAYVPGPESENYSFTSSIVVQLIKSLAPDIRHLIGEAPPSVMALDGDVRAVPVKSSASPPVTMKLDETASSAKR